MASGRFFFGCLSIHPSLQELRGSISGSASTSAPRIQKRFPSNQKIATCRISRARSSAVCRGIMTATLHSQ